MRITLFKSSSYLHDLFNIMILLTPQVSLVALLTTHTNLFTDDDCRISIYKLRFIYYFIYNDLTTVVLNPYPARRVPCFLVPIRVYCLHCPIRVLTTLPVTKGRHVIVLYSHIIYVGHLTDDSRSQ